MLTVGGIEPRKGSLTLLDAFAAPAQALPERAPCCSWPAARRCSTTATRSTASTRCASALDLDGSVRVLGPVTDARARAPLPRRRRLRVPLGQGGLRPRRARGAGRRAAGGASPTSTSSATYLADGDSALMAPVGDADALAAALVRAAASPRPAPRGCAPAGARWRRVTAGTPPRRRTRRLRALPGRGEPLMALEVVATWRGGFATDVQARGHAIRVDEPATPAATTRGMMPTELFCAALASCFCLAVGFAARQARPGGARASRSPSAAERAGERAALRAPRRDDRGRARAPRRWRGWSSARDRCAGSPTAWRAG